MVCFKNSMMQLHFLIPFTNNEENKYTNSITTAITSFSFQFRCNFDLITISLVDENVSNTSYSYDAVRHTSRCNRQESL